MKLTRYIAVLAVMLIFLSAWRCAKAAEYYYFDDYSRRSDNLSFVDENGKAAMTWDTKNSLLSVATSSLCYPQFWTPAFTTYENGLIIELKSKFVYGGKTTVRMTFDGKRYEFAAFESVYEWTVHNVYLDFENHTADLYRDGKFVSSVPLAEDLTSDKLISSQKTLNIGHMLNAREAQYDYIAVYGAANELNIAVMEFPDEYTVVLECSNPVPKDLLKKENFSIEGNIVTGVKASADKPKQIEITLGAPLEAKKTYKLNLNSITDIFSNIPINETISFTAPKKDIEILNLLTVKSGGMLKVTVNGNNNSQEDKTCVLVTAFYKTGENGTKIFEKCEITPVTFQAGVQNAKVVCGGIAAEPGCKYECFVWNSSEEMKILY